jgi:hypothetical protein
VLSDQPADVCAECDLLLWDDLIRSCLRLQNDKDRHSLLLSHQTASGPFPQRQFLLYEDNCQLTQELKGGKCQRSMQSWGKLDCLGQLPVVLMQQALVESAVVLRDGQNPHEERMQ